MVAEPEQVKGLEFDHVYLLGLRRGAISARAWEDTWIPDELVSEPLPQPGEELSTGGGSMLAHVAMTRAREALVLAWPERPDEGEHGAVADLPAPHWRPAAARRRSTRRSSSGPPRACTRPTGCSATRCSRRPGRRARRSPRCASTRSTTSTRRSRSYLELVKLAALIQSPGSEAAPEALAAINELLGRVATPEQRIAIEASALDRYVIG